MTDQNAPQDASIEALVLAVTVEWKDGDASAEALRALAKNIWWAGFNTAKQVDYQRDMAAQFAVESCAQGTDITTVLMSARAFEKYLAGELMELPAITDKPIRDRYDEGMTDEQVNKTEAQEQLKRLGLV